MNHFKGKQFQQDVIIVAVGYYLRYNLSYREVQELLYDRGINVCHTTIYRWVQEYSKILYHLWKKKNKQSFYSWKMDETYIKVKGRWHYLYRAIDADGLTLDIWLRKKRRADDNSYKLEDTAYQEDKARKAETEDKLAIEAMKSKYTTLLLENMLLSPFEMQDTKIMAGLQVHVYPLYDELKELRELNSVKDHLSYVASRREEYSKHNIARYLKKAIEQYLPTVKRQDLKTIKELADELSVTKQNIQYHYQRLPKELQLKSSNGSNLINSKAEKIILGKVESSSKSNTKDQQISSKDQQIEKLTNLLDQ